MESCDRSGVWNRGWGQCDDIFSLREVAVIEGWGEGLKMMYGSETEQVITNDLSESKIRK